MDVTLPLAYSMCICTCVKSCVCRFPDTTKSAKVEVHTVHIKLYCCYHHIHLFSHAHGVMLYVYYTMRDLKFFYCTLSNVVLNVEYNAFICVYCVAGLHP